jgi:hypothetical protein
MHCEFCRPANETVFPARRALPKRSADKMMPSECCPERRQPTEPPEKQHVDGDARFRNGNKIVRTPKSQHGLVSVDENAQHSVCSSPASFAACRPPAIAE